MRVVSVACSNTEIVCALGAAGMLVGVDDHSDFPPAVVAELPRVGPDLGIDVGRVAALEPDLVLASLTVPGHEKVVAALADAGLPVVASEPTSLADVARDVREIGRRLGLAARGEEVAASMEAALAAARRRNEGSGARAEAGTGTQRRPSLLVQWWPKPVIAPGRLSWVTELAELAGGVNPLGEEAVKSRPLSDDEVTALAPDAVVLSWCGVAPDKVRDDVVYANPAWQDLPFVARRQVFKVPEALLGRPSPRLLDGLAALRRVVETVAVADR